MEHEHQWQPWDKFGVQRCWVCGVRMTVLGAIERPGFNDPNDPPAVAERNANTRKMMYLRGCDDGEISRALISGRPLDPVEGELFNADPSCEHWVVSAPGGGNPLHEMPKMVLLLSQSSRLRAAFSCLHAGV